MLFLPQSVLDAKDELTRSMGESHTDESQLKHILALDPEDLLALVTLATLHMEAGEHARAEPLLWRALELYPGSWMPYHQLSSILREQRGIADGLAELAFRKLLLDEESIERVKSGRAIFNLENIPALKEMSVEERLSVMVEAFRSQREMEPLDVTARLRPYRLIHQMLELENLEPEMVDVLVGEGASLVPLLIGLVRGWARDLLPESATNGVENALAILGEIGEVSALMPVLETSKVGDRNIAGAAAWAVDRIIAKHPEESARLIGEAGRQLESATRIAAAEAIIRNPKIPSRIALLERLFENLERLDRDDRDHCFYALLASVFLIRGRPGVDTARSLMRRYGSLISRNTRRDCEFLLEDAAQGPAEPPPIPEQEEWTVYQICEGRAAWPDDLADEEAEENEYQDEDEFHSVEPRHIHPTPGRNDPCWCGSGKKYKKCHLDSDREPQAPTPKEAQKEDELEALRGKVRELLEQYPMDEAADATQEFFGGETGDANLALDWIVHDRTCDAYGRTVMEEHLHRHGVEMTERERSIVQSSIRSHFDLYEVLEVKEDSVVEVKSQTLGETLLLSTPLAKRLVPGQGFLTRMLRLDSGNRPVGSFSSMPPQQVGVLRAWIEEDRRRTGLAWPAYFKRNWPRIRSRHEEMAAEFMESAPGLTARFDVLDRRALLSALRGSSEIDERETGTSFVWINGPGSIRVLGGQLTLICKSADTLFTGVGLLADIAGSSITPAGPAPSLNNWADTKNPALGGKTPRQAIKNAAGKRKVAELLKAMERDHKAEAARLRTDLGIKG
jgi:hypothetical protein